MIYDIRIQENAKKTLETLTNVPFEEWEKEYKNSIANIDTEKIVRRIFRKYNIKNLKMSDIYFVFSHITTNSDSCKLIKDNGLLNLRQVYLNKNSDIRKFLDFHNIQIDLKAKEMKFENKVKDITYTEYKSDHSTRVAYKLYNDYYACGFLTISETEEYNYISKYPEFIQDLSNYLKIDLLNSWKERNPNCYEVIAKVKGTDILGKENNINSIIEYLGIALEVAINGVYGNLPIILNVDIPKEDILDIKPFLKRNI